MCPLIFHIFQSQLSTKQQPSSFTQGPLRVIQLESLHQSRRTQAILLKWFYRCLAPLPPLARRAASRRPEQDRHTCRLPAKA